MSCFTSITVALFDSNTQLVDDKSCNDLNVGLIYTYISDQILALDFRVVAVFDIGCEAKKNDLKDKSKKRRADIHIRHKRTNGESLTRGLRSCFLHL
jgi:hypothetical protein